MLYSARKRHNRVLMAKRYSIILAAAALLGVVIELYVSAGRESSDFEGPFARALNLFVFFTVWSNLLVAYTHLLLARSRDGRGDVFWGLLLAAVAGITFTFIIHRLFLAGPLEGWALVSDTLIHVIVPFATVLYWLLYGVRGKITRRTIIVSTLIPNAWLTLTFIRGGITGWYPYEFVDIPAKGFPTILLSITVLYALYFAIIGVFWWAETRGPLKTSIE